MITPSQLAVRYVVFAVLATIANLAAQWALFLVYQGPRALILAMAGGTAAGLIVKYLLDKRWVFFDKEDDRYAEGLQFTLYSATGVLTTAIFWSIELSFDTLINHAWSKYVGAVVGLSIGYIVKYRLDRQFVFRSPAE